METYSVTKHNAIEDTITPTLLSVSEVALYVISYTVIMKEEQKYTQTKCGMDTLQRAMKTYFLLNWDCLLKFCWEL
jgi:hypothetical protein